MKKSLVQEMKTMLDLDIESVKENEDLSCSLWAGYGQIIRLTVRLKDGKLLHLAHKFVSPPQNQSSISHTRKVTSYCNEVAFYQKLSKSLVNNQIPVPKLYYSECDLKSGKCSILMSDLTQIYPIENAQGVDDKHIFAVCDWLARFHSFGWGKNLEIEHGLSKEGCYWYLDTRQDEWRSMGKQWQRLKNSARAIADQLKPSQLQTAGWTLIHGDAKDQNFLFNQSACAGIDFQYCGGGFGARDLAMMLLTSQSLQIDDLEHGQALETEILKYYYKSLTEYLTSEEIEKYPYELLLAQFELALMDLVRFLAGWGMWGNCGYASKRAMQLLESIDNSQVLSEEEYIEKFKQKYQ